MTAPLLEIGGARVALTDAFEIAFTHHAAGRLDAAKAIYDRILALDPDHSDSLHLTGLIAQQAGDIESALTRVRRAIAINPDAAPYHNSLGSLLLGQGQLETAGAHFRRAFELRPSSPEIASNLASVLRRLGRSADALQFYRAALALAPQSGDILCNLAAALIETAALDEAESHLLECLRHEPDRAQAYHSLGNQRIQQRRWAEAEAMFRAALDRAPGHARTANNLGIVRQQQGFAREAEACYREAVRLAPDFAEAFYNLGAAVQADGRSDEAAQCYTKALALKPDFAAARIALCMANLPILYADEDEIHRCRAAYTGALEALHADAGTVIPLAALADGAGSAQPFFLPYQGFNDRSLQTIYGDLLVRAMAAGYASPAIQQRPVTARKIRLGIVSGFFNDHTIWKLFLEGWLTRIDRARFEIHAYHTGTVQDETTARAAGLCARFVGGGRSVAGWRDTILADQPDILLYPEIGMDPMAARLGALRLARRQYVTWGHPETTGYPTIDGFLSNRAMEPPDYDDHYTEPVVLLPHLSTYYEPGRPPGPPIPRPDFGLRPEATVFWSGQAIYKYLPQYAGVFPKIARAVPDCQFLFIEFAKSAAITSQFKARLTRAFAAEALDAETYCIFAPAMGQERFLASVGVADVLLDTIGWSGGKSTLDCLAHNPAIVTLEGPLMRGRHTAAILRRLGIEETIADSVDRYIDIAIRLGRNPAERQAIRARIADNKHLVYCDDAYIAGLEDFLARAAAE